MWNSKLTIGLTKFLVWIALIVIIPYQAKGGDYKSEPSSWAKTVVHGEQRKTVMQFYLRGVGTGESPTAILVVRAPGDSLFGGLAMIDHPLRVGPNPDSMLVGLTQGVEGGASREGEEVRLIVAFTYTFSEGMYNGSSLSILGNNPLLNPVRELPVIGGTGVFRMARGYVFIHTYLADTTSGIIIIGHNLTVFHS